MKIPFNYGSTKKAFLAVLLVLSMTSNVCFADREAEYKAKYDSWAGTQNITGILEDLEFDGVTLTDEQYKDLEKLVNLRPEGSENRSDLLELLDDIIYASMDDYGLYYWEDFEVIDEFDEDPDAPAFDMGKKILALGKTAMTEPLIIPEAPEGLQDIYKKSAPSRLVLISYQTGGNTRYLKADENGYLVGGATDPIDAASNFEFMLIEDKIGFRSKTASSDILSIRKVSPGATWLPSAKQEASKIKFDAKLFSKNTPEQQLVAEPIPDTSSYQIRSMAFNNPEKDATQVGYMKIDTRDNFVRAQDPNTEMSSTTHLEGFDSGEAVGMIGAFTIQALTRLHKDLAKARKSSNVKTKIETFQGILQNRGAYIFTSQDLKILLEEIENTLTEAYDQEKIRQGLEQNSDAFYGLIDKLSGTFSQGDIYAAKASSPLKWLTVDPSWESNSNNSTWTAKVKQKFEELSGQVPKDFDSMLYPDQVSNLSARFIKLSENTIEEFIEHLRNVVRSDDPNFDALQAFEPEIETLTRIINQLPLKNVFKARGGEIDTELTDAISADGILGGFQTFLSDNYADFIIELQQSLRVGRDSVNPLKDSFTKQEQDFFIKKVKRLVENREEGRDVDVDGIPALDALKELINQAAINLMPERYEELQVIAATLESDQVKVFEDIEKFSEKLKFLEDRRPTVKGLEEVKDFLANLWSIVSDRFKASPDQITRMQRLADALLYTKEFETNKDQTTQETDTGGPTVLESIENTKTSLESMPTYEDLITKIESIATDLNEGTPAENAEVEYVYDSSFYLSQQVELSKNEVDNMAKQCRVVLNNISLEQYSKHGKKLQDLVDILDTMSEDLKQAEQGTSQFDKDLKSLEKRLYALKDSSPTSAAKKTILEDLEKLIFDRLDAKNAEEIGRMESLVEWAYNHPKMQSMTGILITSIVDLKKYSVPKFLDHLIKLIDSEISFFERVSNLKSCLEKVISKDMEPTELVTKANQMAEVVQTARNEDLEEALNILNKIMFQEIPSLRMDLKAARTAIEQRKNQLGSSEDKDYGTRLEELEKMVFSVGEDQVTAFIKELWWLVENRVKATPKELNQLTETIDKKIRYDEAFKERKVPNYPEGQITSNIEAQAFFDAAIAEIKVELGFGTRLSELVSSTILPTPRSKNRYLEKAGLMVESSDEFNIDNDIGGLKPEAKNILNEAIFELEARRANVLSDEYDKVGKLIDKLILKRDSTPETVLVNFQTRMIDIENSLFKITKQEDIDAFMEDLWWLAKNKLKGTPEQVVRLTQIIKEQIPFDPNLKGVSIPNYPEDKESERITFQMYLEKLSTKIDQEVTFQEILNDLEATTNFDNPTDKTAYLEKASLMVDSSDEFSFPPGASALSQADKNVLNEAIFELQSKKAFKLSDMASQLHTLITKLEEKRDSTPATVLDNFQTRLAGVESTLFEVSGQVEVDKFLGDAWWLAVNKLKATPEELDRLEVIIKEKIPFDPNLKAVQIKNHPEGKTDRISFERFLEQLISKFDEQVDFATRLSNLQSITSFANQDEKNLYIEKAEIMVDSAELLEFPQGATTLSDDDKTALNNAVFELQSKKANKLSDFASELDVMIERLIAKRDSAPEQVLENFQTKMAAIEQSLFQVSEQEEINEFMDDLWWLTTNKLKATPNQLEKLEKIIKEQIPFDPNFKGKDVKNFPAGKPNENISFEDFLAALQAEIDETITFEERLADLSSISPLETKSQKDKYIEKAKLLAESAKQFKILEGAEGLTQSEKTLIENAIFELQSKRAFQLADMTSQLDSLIEQLTSKKDSTPETVLVNFQTKMADIEQKLFQVSSQTDVNNFMETLWWLASNKLKASPNELEKLEKIIKEQIPFDPNLQDKLIPNYPDDDEDTDIAFSDYLAKLTDKIETDVTFGEVFANLQAITNLDSADQKTKYLKTADILADAAEQFKIPSGATALTVTDKELIDKAIFELNSKKAFQLANKAADLEALIKKLTAKRDSAPKAETYSDEVIDLDDDLQTLSADNAEAFATELERLINNQVKGTAKDIEMLKSVSQQAQYDPAFETHATYNAAWFKQKLLSLDNGPTLSAVSTFIKNTRLAYINKIKSGEKISQTEKSLLSEKIAFVISIFDSLTPGDVNQLQEVIQSITAIKMRIMPEKASELDTQIANIEEKIEDLKKVQEEDPTDFKSDLEKLKAALEDLFLTSDEDEKSIKAEAFATQLEGMVARISEGLKSEREELSEVIKASERLQAVKNTSLKFDELNETLKEGPTGTGMVKVLEEITSKTDLTKRERQLSVELATIVDQKKSAIYIENEGEETLRKTVDALKTISTFQLKKFKKESGTVESFASKIDGFLASFSQALDNRWAKFDEGLVAIKGMPLSGINTLNDFVEEVSKLVENKAYATQGEINELIGLLTGPFVTNSPAYFTNGDEVAERLDPIIVELQKPLTFKLRAENLLALISNDSQDDYENLVAERLAPLVADRTKAFDEDYKLDRLINAIGFLENWIVENAASVGAGEKRPLDAALLKKYKEQLNESVLQMGRKQQTAEDRIAATEVLLKSSKNKTEVEKFFRELESIVESKIELNSSETKAVERKLIGAAGRRGEWRNAPGMSKSLVKDFEKKLEALGKELAKPLKNKDRLYWLNMKVYGESDPGSSKSVTDEEMSDDEQEMFLKVAKTALGNARQSDELSIQGFIDVLWDAYYYENKIGENSNLEKMAYSFEDAKERKMAGTSYRDELENLETAVNELIEEDVSNFLSSVEGLVNNKAEALDDELERVRRLLQSAKSKRAIQATSGAVNQISEMLTNVASPTTPEELFNYICGEIGVDPNDGKPGATTEPDEALLNGDDDKINLMVIKITELVEMKQQISDMETLKIWREALSFTMNNELASKGAEVQAQIDELNAYISGFQSAVFKTVTKRVTDLETELRAIPEVRFGDAPNQIAAFVDGLDENLVKFRTDADTQGAANELEKMTTFLSKKARLHSLVFTDKSLRKKVDDLIVKAKEPIPFTELADRLEEITFANTNFSEDIKKTFLTVLTKAVDAREGAPQEKLEYLTDEIISFATNRRFNEATDKTRLDRIAELTALISKPTLNALISSGKYQEAYDQVKTDSLDTSTHSEADWLSHLTKLSEQVAVNALVEGKNPTDKQAFIEEFKGIISRVASATTDADTKAALEAINLSGASVDDLISLRDYPAALDKLIEESKVSTNKYTKEQWAGYLTKLSGMIERILEPKASKTEKVTVLREFSKLVQDVVMKEFMTGNEDDKAMGNTLINNIVFRKIDPAMASL